MINLTMHKATPDQSEAGVTDLPAEKVEKVKCLLNFQNLPTSEDVEERAARLAELAAEEGATSAMIGGAPFLMAPLAQHLKQSHITPFFAFSRREVVEGEGVNGEVVKTSVFRHAGFVAA